MDRNFSELVSEVLSLDTESKRELADALDDDLARSPRVNREALDEARRRLDALNRGELQTVDAAEAIARVRKSIRR